MDAVVVITSKQERHRRLYAVAILARCLPRASLKTATSSLDDVELLIRVLARVQYLLYVLIQQIYARRGNSLHLALGCVDQSVLVVSRLKEVRDLELFADAVQDLCVHDLMLRVKRQISGHVCAKLFISANLFVVDGVLVYHFCVRAVVQLLLLVDDADEEASRVVVPRIKLHCTCQLRALVVCQVRVEEGFAYSPAIIFVNV